MEWFNAPLTSEPCRSRRIREVVRSYSKLLETSVTRTCTKRLRTNRLLLQLCCQCQESRGQDYKRAWTRINQLARSGMVETKATSSVELPAEKVVDFVVSVEWASREDLHSALLARSRFCAACKACDCGPDCEMGHLRLPLAFCCAPSRACCWRRREVTSCILQP